MIEIEQHFTPIDPEERGRRVVVARIHEDEEPPRLEAVAWQWLVETPEGYVRGLKRGVRNGMTVPHEEVEHFIARLTMFGDKG
jgi:hypothetical protein